MTTPPVTVLALVLLALLPAAATGAEGPPWLPAPPIEYALDGEPERTDSSARFNYDTLGWVNITGDVWTATYVPRAGLTRAPLDVLRHYRDQIDLRKGRRLLSIVGSDEDGQVSGGQMAAHIPGTPPLWMEVHVEREQIHVTLIVQRTAEPVTLPVPPERTPGRWSPDPVPGGAIQAADRPALGSALAALSRFFREAPMLSAPRGFDAGLSIDPTQDGYGITLAGTHGATATLHLAEVFQPCDTCGPRRADEGGTFVSVHVNDLARVLTQAVDDEQGQPMYEVDGVLDPAKAVTRLHGGNLVVVRPGAAPLWTPVTREAYLKARIKDARARIAKGDQDVAAGLKEQEAVLKEIEKTNPAMAREVRAQMAEALKHMPAAGDDHPAVAPFLRELASLSDKEKAAPAEGSEGRRIVRLNPAYVDRGRAPGAPQALVVEFGRSQAFYYRDIVERMKGLDWATVAAIVR